MLSSALVDSLQIGDIRSIETLYRETEPLPDLTPFPYLSTASLSTVTLPCWTPERRAELAQAGAEMVEMEAAGVAQATREFDPAIPVHAIKIVSDQAGAEADPVIGAGLVKNPLRVVRFKFRALRLSHGELVQALLAALLY